MKSTVTENPTRTLRIPAGYCRRVAKFCCDLSYNSSECERLRKAAALFMRCSDGFHDKGLCDVEAPAASFNWLYSRIFKTAAKDKVLNAVCWEISVQMGRDA